LLGGLAQLQESLVTLRVQLGALLIGLELIAHCGQPRRRGGEIRLRAGGDQGGDGSALAPTSESAERRLTSPVASAISWHQKSLAAPPPHKRSSVDSSGRPVAAAASALSSPTRDSARRISGSGSRAHSSSNSSSSSSE
jgi:hypothetical protein